MEITPQSTGPEILAAAERLVIKFGGDNAGEFAKNLALTLELLANGKQFAMVFSAIRSSASEAAKFSLFREGKNAGEFNTTSHLIEMAKAAKEGDDAKAKRFLQAVQDFTLWMLEGITEEGQREAMRNIVREECQKMWAFLEEAVRVHPLAKEGLFFEYGINGNPVDHVFASNLEGRPEVSFTGFGEQLAEKLYAFYLNANGVQVGALQNETLPKTANMVDEVREGMRERIRQNFEKQNVLVSGGYLRGAAESRGYSDVAAVLVSQAMKKPEEVTPLVFIAKQSAIESIDRKILPDGEKRRWVQRISKLFGIELFDPNGADAAALHPDAMKLLTPDMNLVVGNPSERDRLTWISGQYDFIEESGAQIFARKKIPDVLIVSGAGMVERPGVLETIINRFKHVSIGHTHTDAGSVTVTFNQAPEERSAEELAELLQSLYGAGYEVKMVSGQAWVFCLGNQITPADVAKGFQVFVDEGVASLRQLGSPLVFKWMVEAADAERITRALHTAFFDGCDNVST